MSVVALVCTAFLPASWAIAVFAFGMLTVALAVHQKPIKIGFNVGKETLAVAVAALAAHLVGAAPESGEAIVPLAVRVLGLAAAAFGYAVVDEVLSGALFALITRTPIRQRIAAHLDASLSGRLISFLIVFLAIWAYSLRPWFVAGLPFLVYALHLASANQLRSRTERRAWQRLAETTDELNTIDLERVLVTAVHRAVDLFSADEVDLEVRLPPAPPRLLRGNHDGAVYDGTADSAPESPGYVIPAALDPAGSGDVSRLRLRFQGPVSFSEREMYTLRTFATALNTAIRNAATLAAAKSLAERHEQAAHQDPLTSLANRLRLRAYGAELLATLPAPQSIALLLIDLNHFKEVNEALGHGAGDRLLVTIARRLKGTMRSGDLVARLGGDEFAVLLVDASDTPDPTVRAYQVLNVLDAPIDLDGTRIAIGASAGIATPALIDGIDELLRRADVAMYQAKRTGQRLVVYQRSYDTASVGSLALGGDLARAIRERQFTLDFQPIVDLGTGKVIAAEALARWQHPQRGRLPPDQFLGSIERSGQLPAFAETVLDQALTAAGRWKSAGFDLDIAVNVSPRSLLDPGFPAAVQARLAAHDVSVDALVIELTESVTLSQLKVVDEVLTALSDIGVRLALDDFGTGFSSLSTVTRMPVYELKIDRSFVLEMDTPAAGAIVRSTIELGRSLDVLVVAEGVETEEQRGRLWELGCPAGQGYLFARPMPTSRLLARLHRGTGGQPGTLAAPIGGNGSVIQLPTSRRPRGDQRRFDKSG